MKSYIRLSLSDRIEIEKLLSQNLSVSKIAVALGRSRSTLKREIDPWRKNGYCAEKAHFYASKGATLRKRRKTKLSLNKRLYEYVHSKLQLDWSPQEISNRLEMDHPDDLTMRVSHESIYDYVYVHAKGELKKELITHLRQSKGKRGRKRSQGEGSSDGRGKIPNAVSIEQRHLEVESREFAGDWEGDLIKGKENKTAIGTLTERKTRTTIIVKLESFDAETVRLAFEKEFKTLPEQMRKTFTYDNGKETSGHLKFTENLNMAVYFCHPHSPWERGTNENTNGLIRQYFPKGTDFSLVSEEEIKFAQERLNNRPRKVLNWHTPKEVFDNEILKMSP